jgi:dethiobiotin synthetase
MSYSIVGIHTGIGKTVCSALLCQAWGYDYWKPVQAGELESTDSMVVSALVRNQKTVIHPERYRLAPAASPHYAAELEQITIQKQDFVLPKTQNGLIVETAGGLMSPLGPGFLNVDLVAQLELPVILVSKNYLGSINHTLMTFAVLQKWQIPIHGIVFMGPVVPATEAFILEYTGMRHLFSVPEFPSLDAAAVQDFATSIPHP